MPQSYLDRPSNQERGKVLDVELWKTNHVVTAQAQ